MSQIELDPNGVEAAVKAMVSVFRSGSLPSDQALAQAGVRAYLAQALRRRDPFDVPVGIPVLWKFKGYQLMIGTVEAPECEGECPHRVDVNDPDGDWFIIDAEWWLPLPQPVEPQP